MTNAVFRSSKLVVFALVLAMLTVMFTVFTPKAEPAFGACNGDQGSFGCGGEAGSPGDGNGGTGGEATRPGAPTPSPGTGGPAPAPDPYMKTERHLGNNGFCFDRDDGKPASGWDDYYTAIFQLTWEKDIPPAVGWEYQGYYPGYGHQWKFMKKVGFRCLYPPRTQLVTQRCIISTTAVVEMIVPTRKTLASKTSPSGFAENSGDWDACVTARSFADAEVSITEQGFYHATVKNRVQNVVYELSLTADDVTGEMPGPRKVSASPAYDTTPTAITGSLHCSTKWVSPAVQRADYNDTSSCQKTPDNPNGVFQCSLNDVPKINGYDARPKYDPVTKKNHYMQILGNGEGNKVTFNQRISGDNLTVTSINTQFSLSADSSPFIMEGKFATPNELLTELYRGPNDNAYQNIMGVNRNTPIQPGKVDEVYLASHTESAMHLISDDVKALKLSQSLIWEGILRWESVKVVGLEPGKFVTVPVIVETKVPGVCTDTAGTTALRPHGDAIG